MSRAAAVFAVDKRLRVVADLLEYNQGDDLLKSLILRKKLFEKYFSLEFLCTLEKPWKKRGRNAQEKWKKITPIFARTVSYIINIHKKLLSIFESNITIKKIAQIIFPLEYLQKYRILDILNVCMYFLIFSCPTCTPADLLFPLLLKNTFF